MPVIHVTDGNGCSMTLRDLDGYLVPNFPLENYETRLRSIISWKARDDDILLCTYPKSGTHWIWEIIMMVLNKKAERTVDDKGSLMLEGIKESDFNNKSSPRVINSHLYLQYLPKDCFVRKCKIVLINRNPKDVAVSFFNHHKKMKIYEYEGNWDGYFKLFTDGKVDYGSWFDYIQHMEKFIAENPDYPIHVVHYEDMKENGPKEIRRLANFFSGQLQDDLVHDIDKLCQFELMKKDRDDIALQKPEFLERMFKDNMPVIYRKGMVSDWKNWFTVAQNETFDSIYANKMKNAKTKFRFSLSDKI